MALLILATIILSIYLAYVLFLEHRKRYWIRKGLPSTELDLLSILSRSKESKAHFLVLHDKYLVHKKLGNKHFGVFSALKPLYVPIDPDLVRNILSKDFNYFMDRGVYYNEKYDPISAQLFNLEGQRWKNLRARLTPTFTSGKMKMMFQTLVDCGLPMVARLEKIYQRKEAVDIKEVLACFTTDVIGSCAFGLECNSFKSETEDSAFRAAGKNFFGNLTRMKILRILATQFFPEACKVLGVGMFAKSDTGFYFDVVQETVKYREDNNISRNDFMHMLIQMKHEKADPLTVSDIAAQSFLFFLAGFETSSTLMHFCCYELTQYPEVQEKVREELMEALKQTNGELTYEMIFGLKYLGQVLDETLRKYPPLASVPRVCVKDYKVPGTDVTIEAGTKVGVPVYSLHHDPENYPDPEIFDPERFSDENKAKRHPYVFIPFGEGPRICIGLRFGLMQSRVGMALLLKNFRIKLHSKTVTPIGISPTAFVLSSKNTIWIELEKLEK